MQAPLCDDFREGFNDQVRDKEVGEDEARAGHHHGHWRLSHCDAQAHAGETRCHAVPWVEKGACIMSPRETSASPTGEIYFDFESVEGQKESFAFHIVAVNKALGSVAYVVGRSFRVVYDTDIETVHKPTKKTFRLRRERNVWILDAIVGAESVFGDFSRPE